MRKSFNPPSEMGNGQSRSIAQGTRNKMLLCYNDIGFAGHIKSIGGIHIDNQSMPHTRWNCTYHIVLFPSAGEK